MAGQLVGSWAKADSPMHVAFWDEKSNGHGSATGWDE